MFQRSNKSHPINSHLSSQNVNGLLAAKRHSMLMPRRMSGNFLNKLQFKRNSILSISKNSRRSSKSKKSQTEMSGSRRASIMSFANQITLPK